MKISQIGHSELGRKVVTHDSKSDLPLGTYVKGIGNFVLVDALYVMCWKRGRNKKNLKPFTRKPFEVFGSLSRKLPSSSSCEWI